LVDNSLISTITPASLPAGTVWAFDHPFFLILNLAVGGNWPGDPSATAFPQRVMIDYVRVYSRADASIPALGLFRSGTNYQVSWPSDFPHANLQRTSNLRLTWTNYPTATSVFSNDFRALVEPGYYRLRIIPQ
jgi:beta-glucanase (GH16 family)